MIKKLIDLIDRLEGWCEYEMLANEDLPNLTFDWRDIWACALQDHRHCRQPRAHEEHMARWAVVTIQGGASGQKTPTLNLCKQTVVYNLIYYIVHWLSDIGLPMK